MALGNIISVTAGNVTKASDINGLNDYFQYDSSSTQIQIEPKASIIKPIFHVQHQETAGTDGDGIASGSWVTTTLNTTVTNTIDSASLSSNQITLPNGTYFLIASKTFYRVNKCKAKWRRVTASAADILIGSSEYSYTVGGSAKSIVYGRFVVSGGPLAYELQARVETTNNTNGGGINSNFAVVEVYTDVYIIQEVVG